MGAQLMHGKELNINSHQGNGNQNLIASHLLKWLLSKKTRQQILERMWRNGSLVCTLGGNANRCSHYGEQYESPSTFFKNRTTVRSSNFTSEYAPKGNEKTNLKKYIHSQIYYL